MRVVIVGAGVVGLCLARGLRRRGLDPLVVERAPAGVYRPRPFMLPYHGFDALGDAGVLDAVRAVAWEIAPQADGTPVALAAPFVRVSEILADGIPVAHEREVTGLLRDGGRVTGVRLRDPSGGERDEPADLVVACDGVRSPTRAMAGIDADSLAEGAHLSFMSPAVIDRPFALHYQADGRQVGLLGWPDGSAGSVGHRALRPRGRPGARPGRLPRGLRPPDPRGGAGPRGPHLRGAARLPRGRGGALRALVGARPRGDRRCRPPVGPEAGLGAGLGLGDALALAVALEQNAGTRTAPAPTSCVGARRPCGPTRRSAPPAPGWRVAASSPPRSAGRRRSPRSRYAPSSAPRRQSGSWPNRAASAIPTQ